MNPEKYLKRKEGEAYEIQSKVDEFREAHPRSKKSEQEVADAVIKGEAKLLDYSEIRLEDRAWYMSMKRRGIRVLQDGFLDISKWEPDQEGGKRVTRQKVNDLLSAIRMQEHIIEGYRHDTDEKRSEITTLESIEETIEYAQELLLRWGTVDNTEREGLKQELMSVVLTLEKCRNEFKVRAEAQAEAVVTLRDSRGRENPSALSARTVSALENLGKRMEEIHAIAPMIALRKEMLALEAKKLEGVLKNSRKVVTLASRHVYFSPHTRTHPDSIKVEQLQILWGKLSASMDDLTTIKIQPYLARAEQAYYFLSTLKDSFRTSEAFIQNASHTHDVLVDVSRILTFESKNY